VTGGAATGGSVGVGGTGGSGGSYATGGSDASGGAASSGGTVGTGGTGGSGGSVSAGGSGGSGASGGSSGTGGTDGTGGAGEMYSPCPTDNTPCAILPLGDSITEGYGSSGGGYRVELFRQAVKSGKHITFVGGLQNGPNQVENQTFPRRHQGHGGFTIDGITGSITNGAIDTFHPHIVLLMIGTNDINGNIDRANAPTRLGNLIDDIIERSPDTLVVVAKIIPIDGGANPAVITYNASIDGVVAARASNGKHVIVLDNYAAIQDEPSWKTTLLADYLHPNDAGYAVLGQSFYGAIQSYLH
jgi:lysophospholipase L1-like esterase